MSFIAKQPNGLYCRFSTILDTVTDYNLTAEQYVDLCVKRAREQARKLALEELKKPLDFEEVKDQFYPSNTGVKEFNKILHEMGDKEGLGENRIRILKEVYDYD